FGMNAALRHAFGNEHQFVQAYRSAVIGGFFASGDLAEAISNARDGIVPPMEGSVRNAGDYIALRIRHAIPDESATGVRTLSHRKIGKATAGAQKTAVLDLTLQGIVAQTIEGAKHISIEGASDAEISGFLRGYDHILLRSDIEPDDVKKVLPQ